MILRWKKNPRPTGLARIGSGPVGSKLRSPDGEEFAVVYAHHGRSATYAQKGWYWVAPANAQMEIPYFNSCHETDVKTEAEAKAAAVAYIRKYVK